MAMVKRFIEDYEGVVASIAYEFSRKYRMVDIDDLRQELWVWFLTHPNKVKVWHDIHDKKQSTKLIARSLRNAAKDYCQKEKARSVGFRVEDNYYYDKNMLESLIPAVLTGNREAPAMNVERTAVVRSSNVAYRAVDAVEVGVVVTAGVTTVAVSERVSGW